jgi:hypothetical protein
VSAGAESFLNFSGVDGVDQLGQEISGDAILGEHGHRHHRRVQIVEPAEQWRWRFDLGRGRRGLE